jgi:RNA polymerase sigma-70 factor (ECF subfamily)
MELIVERILRGDKEAFIQAINEYKSQMYKVARARLNSEDDIGDAIQDTILSAYKNIHSLKEPRFFKTWIIRILINKCNDIVKKKSNITYIDDYTQVAGNPSMTVHEECVEDRINFTDVIKVLKEEYRMVVTLYYVNEFTIKEISEILKVKEGTIKSWLSRSRQQLKNYYLNNNIDKSSLEVLCDD